MSHQDWQTQKFLFFYKGIPLFLSSYPKKEKKKKLKITLFKIPVKMTQKILSLLHFHVSGFQQNFIHLRLLPVNWTALSVNWCQRILVPFSWQPSSTALQFPPALLPLPAPSSGSHPSRLGEGHGPTPAQPRETEAGTAVESSPVERGKVWCTGRHKKKEQP